LKERGMMITGKRNLHACCFLVMLATFFMTSPASALLTAKDVANQVKEAMRAGATAEDAVKSVIASAIVQGMSVKDAAAASTKAGAEVAFTLAKDINATIQGAVSGAASGAIAAGQDANAAIEGACQGVISAAAAADADTQLAAWMAVGASVKHAMQHNRDSAVAACAAVTGAMTGADAFGLGSKEIAGVVSGSTKGAIATAMITGQDTRAMATAVQSCVYSAAETHGLDPADLAMVAAKAASTADTIPTEVLSPPEMAPARRAPEGPAMPAPEPDPIEPVPDPVASGV
jgi:hypothetical protein